MTPLVLSLSKGSRQPSYEMKEISYITERTRPPSTKMVVPVM